MCYSPNKPPGWWLCAKSTSWLQWHGVSCIMSYQVSPILWLPCRIFSYKTFCFLHHLLVWPLATCRCLVWKGEAFLQDDTIHWCSKSWELESCLLLFLGDFIWLVITHPLIPHHCHCCLWLCHLRLLSTFPQRIAWAIEGLWGSLALLCYLLVPWEKGHLGVETKHWREDGNSFIPLWATVGRAKHSATNDNHSWFQTRLKLCLWTD